MDFRNNRQPEPDRRIWKAAFYIRLSKEDFDRGQTESESISNQREILTGVLKLHPDIVLADTYVDDGVSGTTYDRPSFLRLKQDIDSGKIDCVMVKDLSRLGRNYSESGDLIDNYFAQKGVRFISFNNGIDTAGDGMNAATRCISIGVTNVINESYAASTSVNIRGTLNNHRLQGKFIGAFASYGYKKAPDDRHRLIVDDEAADIVRMIFHEYLRGSSILGIVKKLNALGIPNPTRYKQLHGFNFAQNSKNDGLWCERTVRRMLENEMYIGNMVQGYNTKINYKIHKCRSLPKSERIIVTGTHEPLVSKEVFWQARELLRRNLRGSKRGGNPDLFSGMIFCADCGHVMSKKTNKHSYGVYQYYKCTTKQKKNPHACTNHTVRIDMLESAVLSYLKGIIDFAADYEHIARQLRQSRKTAEYDYLKSNLASQKKEREECILMIDNLYPTWQQGLLTQNEFLRQKEKLNQKLAALDEKIEMLEQSRQESANAETNDGIAGHFLKHRNIDRLTRPILLEFIDKIYAHDDGSVTVRLKCKDVFEELLQKQNQTHAA